MTHSEHASSEEENNEKDNGAKKLLPGQTMGGYLCQSFLGQGATGRVYLAHHIKLGRHCALKVLSPHVKSTFQNVDMMSRFQDEGRATAALVHPNIVTMHAMGQEDDYHFLEMEFVAGGSLRNRVLNQGVMSPIATVSMLARIADGLAYAHRNGFLHRDMKPDNILLTSHSVPKIADFGLARKLFSSNQWELVGTPQYLAPELYHRGEPTPASDVYSLGMIGFFLLTGRVPFLGKNLEELSYQICTAALPSFRELDVKVPLEIAECLQLMLSRNPANRPQDGAATLQLLNAILGQARSLESLLQEAFQFEASVKWESTLKEEHPQEEHPQEEHRDRVKITVQLPSGRKQRVFIESSEHAPTKKLLLIYTLCCPAVTEYYEKALRINGNLSHGGLAIREVDGVPYFVMQNAYPRGTADAEEIRKSVLEISWRADAIELELTGKDVH